MTVVHPAARAAPSFRVIIAEGKFHGVRIELGRGYTDCDQQLWTRTHTTPKDDDELLLEDASDNIHAPTGCLIVMLRVPGAAQGIV